VNKSDTQENTAMQSSKPWEPRVNNIVVIAPVVGAVVVDRSELKVMISMFNMEKSIYKDHFRISCSKILSIVVILQCPKMNRNGIIVLFRMRFMINMLLILSCCQCSLNQ
jgi:hypothetical protein